MTTPSHRLGEIPLFAGLPPALLEQLAAAGRVRTFQAGQELFSEGDPGDSLLVLAVGQLRISRFTQSGQEVVLAVVHAPDALGELSLLDGAPRAATVTAQRLSKVRLVPRQAFLTLLHNEPAFVEGMMKTLARWVRLANARHADLLSLDVPGRLAKWLLVRADRESATTFDLERTQGELALELGTTRSTLNRALKELEDLGYIAIDGDRVTILDADALRAFLG